MPRRSLTFHVDGLVLRGDLHLPDHASSDEPAPGIVLSGPLTGVKEQVVATYAQRLAEQGYAALAFDHRGFGGSQGRVPQHEDPAGKLADLRAAIGVLARRPEVDPDRLGACGICLGTAYVLRASAFDPRVRAVALVAGAYNDPATFREMLGPDAYREVLSEAARDWQAHGSGSKLPRIPAVSPDPEDDGVAMPGEEPWTYYGTDRGATASWRNELTRASLAELLTFDAAGAAPFLEAPALFVHGRGDGYCPPEAARAVHEAVQSETRYVELDTDVHIDLYDQEPRVQEAVSETATWFDEHLAPV